MNIPLLINKTKMSPPFLFIYFFLPKTLFNNQELSQSMLSFNSFLKNTKDFLLKHLAKDFPFPVL